MTNSMTPASGPARTTLGRKSIWRTGLVEIVGLLVFVGIVELLVSVLNFQPTGDTALIVSIVLAVIPAALWLLFFYAQDRAEPEPLHFVAGVAVLGGLLAAAIGQPLINTVFRTADWLPRDTLTEILGSILVVGFTQEFLKYVAVRFSIYNSGEFNQRIDGVVYGTAAGVGYATALNIATVLSAGGFADLNAGVIRIVVTALAQGVLGGLVGYFLGRNRMENRPIWWMPLGIALAAIINGLSSWVRTTISIVPISLSTGGGGFSPWPSLIWQTIVAVAVLFLVLWLMRRANMNELATDARDRGNTNSLIATVIVTAVAILLGLLYRDSIESRVKPYTDSTGVAIQYPAWWTLDTADAASGIWRASDSAADTYATTLELQSIGVDPTVTDDAAIAQASAQLSVNRAQDLGSLKVFDLATGPEYGVKGLPGGEGSYVFVSKPGTFLQESLPAVVLGDDTFVRKGSRVYVFSLQSTEANRPLALKKYRAFIDSATLP